MKNKNIYRKFRKSSVKSIGKIKSVLFLFLGLAISANVNAQVTFSTTAASAVGVNDGQAIAQAIAGIGNYTYTWTNATTGVIVQGPTTNALLSDTLSNTASGSYVLTFTDNGSSTTITDTVTITAPGGSFTFNKNCDTLTDVTAFVAGCTFLNPVLGTQYVVTDASSTTVLDVIVLADSVFIPALASGTYTVTALNLDNGCTANGSVTVNGTPFTVNSTVVNTLSTVACDGSVSANVLSGQFPYTFTLTNSSGTVVSSTVGLNMSTLSLCDDTYCLNVEDANSCVSDECLEVLFIPCDVNLSVSTPIPCNGGVGDIQVDLDTNNLPLGPVAFTGPRYTYTLFTVSPYVQINFQGSNNNSFVFSGLPEDSYSVSVFDASYGTNCLSDSITLTEPNIIQIFTTVDSTSAPWISDGQITIDSITGGTPGFTIEWRDDNGAVIPGTGMTQTGLSYSNSFTGGYTIFVTDSNGCVGASSVYIHPEHSGDSLRVDSSHVTHVTCFGDCDGQLWAQLDSVGTNAIPPFTFEWKNAAGTIIRTDVITSPSYNIDHSAKYSSICAGDYSLTITDFYNNTIDFTFPTLTEPLALTLDLGPDFTIDCGEDTLLTATPVGGNTSNDTILFSTHVVNLTGTPTGFQDTLIPGTNYLMVVSGTCINFTQSPSNFDAAYQYGPPSPVVIWQMNGVTPARPVPDVYNLGHTYNFPFVATTANTTFSFPNAGFNGTLTFQLYQINTNVPFYNYSWTTNPPTGVVSTTNTVNAYPGTSGTEYILNVEDVLGCSAADAVFIDRNLEILNFTSVTSSDLNCNGDTLAYIAMAVDSSTGFSPYTFYVDNAPIVGDSTANLSAGTHIIYVEDTAGCKSADSTVIIYQPDSLYACGVDTAKVAVLVESFTMTFNASFSHTLASPLSSGVDYRLVVSGTYNETWGAPYLDAAYQFNVSPQIVSNVWTLANLAPVTIRPTIDVYNPAHTYEYSLTGNGLSATFGYTDGDGDFTANGGALTFDLYKLVCSNTDTAFTCFGDSTATAFVSPVGGTPFIDGSGNPYYNVVWTDNLGNVWGTSATVTGLPAGFFTATITDSLGCSYERYLQVIQSALPLQVDSLSQVNVLCKGDSTGEIFSLVSGGFTTSYATLVLGTDTIYNVSGVLDTIHITGLVAGTYNLYLYDTIPDALYGVYGCPQDIQIDILEPQDHLSSTVNLLSDVPCFGDSTGVAIATAIGGQAGYTYVWDSGAFGQIANNLWAGWHTVLITDANGCTLLDSIEIINLHAEITGTIQIIEQVSCFGACDAIVELSTTGGVLQHHYDWDIGPDYYGSGPDTNYNLCYGGHDVIVIDAIGCQKTISFNITQPDELFATANNIQDVQCYGFDDGMASAIGTGGTPAYTFVWDSINGPVGPNIDSLTPGIHTVYLTDANGCTASDTVVILEPTQLTVEIIDSMTVYSYCLGTPSGQLCAQASGGTPYPATPNYTYIWNDPLGQNTPCAYDLIAGVYTVIVVDDRSCTASATFDLDSITSSMNPDSVDLTITDVSCFGGYNGSVMVNSVVGAVGPLTYEWTGCATTITGNPITSLEACSYSVIITDSFGCAITVNAEVEQPDELRYKTYNVIDETCLGACDGQIWVYAEGGTGDYYYDGDEVGDFTQPFSNPIQLVNDSLIFNLCEGLHSIYLTDDNGCEGAVIWNSDWQETVGEGVVVDIPGVMTSSASCSNSNDGAAWIQWPGANPLFTYTWETYPAGIVADTGVSTEILYPGNYMLVAHYADSASFGQVYHGCNDTALFTITAPLPIVSGAVLTDVSCFDEEDGSITLNPSGGMGGAAGYTYQWDVTTSIPTPFLTQQNQTNLLPGTYTVTITDTNSCELTEDYIIGEPDPITASITYVEPLCFADANGSATVVSSGGILPHTYNWNPGSGATVNGLQAGSYTVTVTDANSCQGDFEVIITEPTQIISSVEANSFYGEDGNGNPYHISCNGLADGSAIVYNGGGIAPLNYVWNTSPVQTTAQATGLSAGVYSVTVVDASLCTETQMVTIVEPDTLVANGLQSGEVSIYGFDISCYGLSDGWVELDPTGGVTFNGGVYHYDWTGPFSGHATNTSSINGVIHGTYDVRITDANGCFYDTTFVLIQPADTFIAVVTTVNYAGPSHPPVMVMFEDATITPNTIPADPVNHTWYWNDMDVEPFTNSAFNMFSYTFTEIGPNEVYVLVQNANTGCIDSVSFIIDVQGIPDLDNVFTPNGDGINDEFVFGEYGMTSVFVNIYNRWGQQVYSWEGDNKAWDGKGADGQNLPEGVYFFVLKADGEDGHYYEEKGSITLIR